jgi:two-component system, NarL family, nitrate/nitrite response regulator NarL
MRNSIELAIIDERPLRAVPAAPPPVSVLLVTGIRMYAEGTAAALDEHDAIGRVTTEPCCETALERLRREPTDIVMLDLAGIDDVAAARAFVRAAAPTPVIALAVRAHDREIVDWAEHGARGIVTREASFEDLLHAVLATARGEGGCSPRVAAALLRRVAGVAAESRATPSYAALTLREAEIAALLVEGLSNKEIAARLLLGVSTVKNHVHNVLSKVNARTRSEAVAMLLSAQDPDLGRLQNRIPDRVNVQQA